MKDDMPKNTVKNDEGQYAALVSEYEVNTHQVIGHFWVVPDYVYKGKEKGRQSIQFAHRGAATIRENWPGASTFKLYKLID